jgi:hypothetical protein
MPAALDLRSLDTPVVQAGMGSVARHELAAAVSDAGGLGTIAGARAPIATEIAAARRLTDKPIAVNLLLPFLQPGDAEAAAAADAIVTFWGTPRRLAANTWMHQCGSVEEAKAAAAAGADAVIAQGVEAGGHVRGSMPMLELLERVRTAVQIPVLAAGGIIDANAWHPFFKHNIRVEHWANALNRRRRCAGGPGRWCDRGGCRHTLLAQRRKPRASRLQATLPRRQRNNPDRTIRARMARRAASSDPQRRDTPLAARRPPRTSLDPRREPHQRTPREPDP